MTKPILMVVSAANRGLVHRCVLAIGLTAVLVLFAVTGCGDGPDQNSEKPKKVVVNEGMSKKEKKKLNERLDELEKKVEEQNKKGSRATPGSSAQTSRPETTQPAVEPQVRVAAEAYYQAVEAEDWGYTYDHLDSETQSAYARDEWFAINEWGATNSPATFTVQNVDMDDSSPRTLANVTVVLTLEDGSTSIRNTFFVYEDGSWKHRFSAEEYEILANARSASASASSSASQTASPSASPNPSPNRGNNAPDPNIPGNTSTTPSEDCISKGGHPVPPGTDGDGDDDGCAGE
jgi:hypothetical protein